MFDYESMCEFGIRYHQELSVFSNLLQQPRQPHCRCLTSPVGVRKLVRKDQDLSIDKERGFCFSKILI